MVLRHFQLREQPFGVTPDPRFLFGSSSHREALAALLYGLDSGVGFVALTANPGMGKTTLLFEVLRRTNETAKTVFLFQTITTPADLFRALLIDLGVDDPRGTLVDHQTQLNQILVRQSAAGKRLVLFLDEAQNLSDSVLEAVRMLSNFETGHRKLMQIVLSGQLQFAERLTEPGLLQLRQRISIYAHLKPLSLRETSEYIQHRLKTAGWPSDRCLFNAAATAVIAQASQGVPRNINNLCFNSLSLACALQKSIIDEEVVREVISDLDIRSAIGPSNPAAIVTPVDKMPLPDLAAAASLEAPEPIQPAEATETIERIEVQPEQAPEPVTVPEPAAVHDAKPAAAPVIAIDTKPEPVKVEVRTQPESTAARRVQAAPARPTRGAIRALEAKMQQEKLTVTEAHPSSRSAATVSSKPQPAPVEQKTSLGLGRALSGSVEELRSRLG